MPKGLGLLIGIKPGGMKDADKGEGAYSDKQAVEDASQDLIDAIGSKDKAAVGSAFKLLMRLCNEAESDEEEAPESG